MRQDKGHNQVVIDWLVNGDDNRVFVGGPGGSLTYGELRAKMPDRRTGRLSAVSPAFDLASVVEIYSGVASGPLWVSSGGEGWTHHQVAENVMTVLSTSGTTGKPKLVPLTIENWETAVRASALHLGHGPEDTWLAAMPLHHVGGLSILFRSSHVGGGVRLLPEFDPATFADALSEVTMASVVPTMLRRILDHDTRRYQGLKAVLVGGGPISEGLLEEAADRGLPVLPTYGMTETCAQVATLLPGSPLEYRADLLPGVEARIEAHGRISLRGDQIFLGYLGEDRRKPGEWFTTGDRGELAGRSLRVLGRADDLIISGGENIDPSSVEATISGFDGVDDCMVVGVPSAEWGSEVVCLYVGDGVAAKLDDLARASLEPFQVPKRWIEVDSLPLTALGKPDRARGRDLAESP
jgi:o-succinylbenzoate---CoA ligase